MRIALAIALALAVSSPALADETPIRVAILRHQPVAVVSSEGGLTVRKPDQAEGSPYVAPSVSTALDIRPIPNGLLLAGAIEAGDTLALVPAEPLPISVNGHFYRGSVIIQNDGDGTLDVINVVDLEQYLYGVVGSEMDPGWPAAALQAQAIVARTYAVAHLGTRDWLGYDLRAGEQDQAYLGMQAEAPASIAAVKATRGSVLVYGPDLVHAYYSSCDGGFTSDGSALSDPQPYLSPIADPYCRASPDEHWAADVPLSTFAAAFAARYGDVGAIRAIDPGAADASGRLLTVTIRGAAGDRSIPATEFRALAGNHDVRSTLISSISVQDDTLHVEGSGFGHGVGMSQWGARTMALDGKSAQEILRFYYKGVEFAQIADELKRQYGADP
ncbi:MAG TPA: SpoIID/LytB domain-containing protein [Candidatus Eremiobacteraceae bacterium]|nr:SpoIID/LytB domain-containing protein [Candidatus Eremiobacteraceae bacterium]